MHASADLTSHHKPVSGPGRILAAALLLACASFAARAQAVPPTVPVQAIDIPEHLAIDGVVEAVRQATLAAQVAGAVTAIEVRAGDAVKSGQLLLNLDADAARQSQDAAQALVGEADAELARAQAEWRRRQALFAEHYISQAALDQARAAYESARAQAGARRAQARAAGALSGHYAVTAPHDGLIGRLDAHLGDMVMPGQPLMTLFDPRALRIQAPVPQRFLDHLAPTARILWPEGQTGLPETLPIQVLPARDAVSLSGMIRLTLPAGVAGPAPGTPVRLELVLRDSGQTRLWIPTRAIVRRADLRGVYVVTADGRARLRQVRLGPQADELTEVLAGLSAGERVVLDPARLPAQAGEQP
jgi:RND family efflux transporter MFP subunit